MANWFYLEKDTLGAAGASITLDSGASFTADRLVDAVIGTSDTDTTGYQMKLWGDIDLAWGKTQGLLSEAAAGTSEEDAIWVTYTTGRQIMLSAGDGNKTVNLKIRDDVLNASDLASDSILLDTTMAIVTISGADVTKISKQPGKNIASFSFQSNEDFVEYKVKIMNSSGAPHDSGVAIPMTNGSVNMGGTGTFPKDTPINCQINCADFELANPADEKKVIKVFVKDQAGNWCA